MLTGWASAQSSLFPVKFLPQLYKVSIQGGRAAEMLLTTPALHAQYDRAENRILYEDSKATKILGENMRPFLSRKISGYTMRGMATIRSYRVFKAKTGIPVWSADENAIYYLNEQSGSFNVWRLSLMDGQPGISQQLTKFQKNPVRFLSVANDGILCFGYDGEIYTLPAGAAQPEKVSIQIGLSDSAAATQIKTYATMSLKWR